MITSKSNELIKKCVQIKQKKFSKQDGLCLVESIKLVKELSTKGLIDIILVTEKKLSFVKDFSVKKIEVISDSLASYLSDTVTPDGVFGICKIPEPSNIKYNRCLVLDRIQDPSNIGAIIRSACAFGYDTIFAINSVYPYTTKCIRSSMGHIFNINYIDVDIEGLIQIKKQKDIRFYVADMNGENIDNIFHDKNENLAIIIGNEGQGVDDRLFDISDKTISISMNSKVESLNASVSAGIIMYLLR